MGNVASIGSQEVLTYTDETGIILNPKIKFPKSGKLVIPISKVIYDVGNIWDCHGAGSHRVALEKCEELISNYLVTISLTKKCYNTILDWTCHSDTLDMCNFLIKNTPREHIDWNYNYVQRNINKYELDGNFELIEQMNMILKT